jgi:predicted DCC family thiol-disulfide oxidoreductase YuxK
MTVLDYLDLRSRLSFVDLERDWPKAGAILGPVTEQQARHALHLASPDSHVTRGFLAFREFARLLPPLWPLLPFLYLPLMDRVGAWAYDVVARNRSRRICRVEACAS